MSVAEAKPIFDSLPPAEQISKAAQLAQKKVAASTALQLVPKETAGVSSKSYGKGRAIERTRQGSGTLAFPPTRPAAIVPAGEAVRYAAWLEEGSLEALDLTANAAGQTAWQLLRTCQPAHLQNSGLIGDLQKLATLQTMERMYADAPAVAALICMGDENSVRFCDAAKNVFGSEYHVREARCQPQRLPFSHFARHLSQWTSKCIFLRAAVRQWLPKESDTDFALRNSPECPAALQTALDEHMDFAWLHPENASQDLQRRHRMGAVTKINLEIGGRNALLPAQYSIQDRFIAQVRGTRRLLVISPEHSFRGLYPFPVHHPYDSHSMVDWERPDAAAWPLCTGVRGRACLLKPGDLLFVPSCWWVHQQLMGPENVALSFTLGLGYRLRPPPAITLRVSRVVEELLGDLQGPGMIRHWLNLLGREEEEEKVDVTTVAGYKQIVACWEARDEVDAVLGRHAWKRLFPAMCIGRLLPTPWLNKDFKEPLYLTNMPRRIADTRTEEQRKYPQLFRHAQQDKH